MEKKGDSSLSEKLRKIISIALESHCFSACSVGYFKFDNDTRCCDVLHCGFTDKDEKGDRVDNKSVYDLASLTKPLVTSLAIMALRDKGKIALEDEIGHYFSGIRRETGKIRISHLLTHSSGLPAHKPYYEILVGYPQHERREKLIQLILKENLLFKPGRDTLYSDLGFILLGFLIENLTGFPLDIFWNNEIVRPLALHEELFFANTQGLDSDVCVVTGRCGWSNRRLCGIVHDDNCRAMGGVAGHAGLFGTLSGVMSLTCNILRQVRGISRHPAYDNQIIKEFLTKKRGATRAYGFDIPSSANSSSGKYFSEMSVGHLGFTGTSFWIDILRGSAVVLLTNRVLMGNDMQQIRKFRPLIHDTIMEYLLKKPD